MSPVVRAFVTFLLCLLLTLVAIHTVFQVVLPPARPPVMPDREASSPRLASHLLLVVVDGLRLDVARDRERMPFFSEAMMQHRSAELWAGRVSMTTSAILSLGTGQRGSFEQMVRNLNPAPPPYDSWLKQGKKAGRRLLLVGDPAWYEMYGDSFEDRRLDPEGVAIDVDFNHQTFRDTRVMRDRMPDVLVAHFVTPDHQGHAYGIQSERYRRHIRDFDRQLHELLREFSPSWTVVVLGDHGAADSGTHGSDVAIQRSTVIYAYGPGISPPGPSPVPRVDQADLAGTLAVLLGVPMPAHSRGHVLVDWLELSQEMRVRVACDDARRAWHYGRALGFALPQPMEAQLAAGCAGDVGASRAVVQAIDRELEHRQGFASPLKLPLLLLCAVLAVGVVVLGLGSGALAAGPWGLSVGALSVLLSWGVEQLAEPWPLWVRVACFAVGNTLALVLLLRPSRVNSWLEHWRGPGVALIPGLLVMTYTSNVQPEAWVALVVGTALVVLEGGLHPGAEGFWGWGRSPALGWAPVFGGALLLTALLPAGVRQVSIYPVVLLAHRPLLLAMSVTALVLTSLVLGMRHAPRRRGWVWVGMGLTVASFLARSHVGPLIGRGCVVLFG
ncbi:MAG: alkaline phosphatase family protein, partial [Myxococcales bacterium]|nr:alkaline phosphatase family protein [Polyangiaceae bacterium]MDW8251954.1 alkaline phosphatase family protein [Myxococcales bacterium]